MRPESRLCLNLGTGCRDGVVLEPYYTWTGEMTGVAIPESGAAVSKGRRAAERAIAAPLGLLWKAMPVNLLARWSAVRDLRGGASATVSPALTA